MSGAQQNLPVTVVIVTFNSGAVIGPCLESIPANVKVSVVDNASADDSVQRIQAQRPDAHIIQSPENLGFGRAMNLAIEQADTEFVLLLNPDARLAVGAIETLVEKAASYPDAAILAPVLYHPDGEQQTSYRTDVFKRAATVGEYIEPAADICTDMVTGAVMLWRMSDMREIGFFDENFFFTYEDDDICMRVRLAGKSLVVVPEATVVHDPGTSTPPSAALTLRKTRYVMTSRLCFERKYRGVAAARRMALIQASKYLFRTLLYVPLFYKKGILRSYGRFHAAFTFLKHSFRD